MGRSVMGDVDWPQDMMLHCCDGHSTHAAAVDRGPLIDMLRRIYADANTPVGNFTLMSQGDPLPPVEELLAAAMRKGLLP
jgi:hypothetical protein